ncbi:MAG: polysaccharide deacetylase family protein [Gracilimonas sp.]|nr:polysaccharide deacetylase family protein [Gracilimonas sp.]
MKDQIMDNLTKLPQNFDARLREVKVLMYHRLMDASEARTNNHWTAVSQKTFREHLKVLEAFNYTAITFNDFRLHILNEIELPKKPVIITFDDAYRDFLELGFPLLKEFGMRAVIFALGDRSITENIWDDPNEISRVPLMNDEELKHLHNEGFEIGAHSCTHPKLTEIPMKEAEREVRESKENLEKLLGSEIHSFCYPVRT